MSLYVFSSSSSAAACSSSNVLMLIRRRIRCCSSSSLLPIKQRRGNNINKIRTARKVNVATCMFSTTTAKKDLSNYDSDNNKHSLDEIVLSDKLHLVSKETITDFDKEEIISGSNKDPITTTSSITTIEPTTRNVLSKKKAKVKVSSTATAYLDLAKAKLSALVVSTTAAGYVAVGPTTLMMDHTSVLLSCLIGTALCSSSAAAMNQIIEYQRDSKMKRTQTRPLVTKQLSVPAAVTAATLWGTAGTTILYLGTDPITTSLGVSNIVLYAGIYTYMKPISVYNTWVGAVVGAIPPVMGWTAASAAAAATAGAVAAGTTTVPSMDMIDTMPAIILASTLYYWQLPHFMALSYMHRADYARGGFAMLPNMEPDGSEQTANVIVRYAWYLSAVPVVATLTNVTNSMFALEGIVLNAYALHVAYKFKYDRTNANARKIFLTSLWYLPSILMLFLLHSKTFDDTIEETDKKDNNVIAKFISNQIHTIRNKGRELCIHEAVVAKGISNNTNPKDSCPITVGSQKINETTEIVQEVIEQQQQNEDDTIPLPIERTSSSESQ